MLATKVILLLLAILGLGKTQKCKEIAKKYHETEDQYHDLGCDEKKCRVLQKKMDVLHKQFEEFGVSIDLL